ncbi:MAG: helix-turn-helix domain-containing protein [Verrucomicrobiia bacterium]
MDTDHKTGIGLKLRQAREAKGLSLAEMANATKLRAESILALENEAFDDLPSLAYVRGFLKIYARELGLDGKQLLRQLDGITDDSFDVTDLRPEDLECIPAKAQPPQFTPQTIGLLLLGLVLAGAAIIAVLTIGHLSKDKVLPVARTLTDLIQPMGAVPEHDTATLSPDPTPADTIPVARAVPATDIPTARAVPAGEIPVARAVPVEDATPAPLPGDPASAIATSTLQFYAAPGTPESKRFVRVIAENGSEQTTLFADIIPEGRLFPAEGDPPFQAEAFVIVLADTSGIDIIFNGQNFGKYPEPGAQQFRIPGR